MALRFALENPSKVAPSSEAFEVLLTSPHGGTIPDLAGLHGCLGSWEAQWQELIRTFRWQERSSLVGLTNTLRRLVKRDDDVRRELSSVLAVMARRLDLVGFEREFRRAELLRIRARLDGRWLARDWTSSDLQAQFGAATCVIGNSTRSTWLYLANEASDWAAFDLLPGGVVRNVRVPGYGIAEGFRLTPAGLQWQNNGVVADARRAVPTVNRAEV